MRSIADSGLDGIAVTDHNTGDWVDGVKQAAQALESTPVIFPGVEVSGLAGNEGIHLLVLFRLDTTSRDIESFLAAIGIVRGTGADATRGTTNKGIVEVLGIVREWEGIAVLAHSQSSKGALASMRGEVRASVIRHPAVLAVEASAKDYYDPTKERLRKRVFDLLDGRDATYGRKLAVFQGSDNPTSDGSHGHSCDGIGSRFTYFQMGLPPSLEGLRQCFVDREVRIFFPRIDGAPALDIAPSVMVPCVARIEVTGGFLDGLDLDLHEGMTSVLGAKGSGKSLLVELMRFALDQSPTQPEIKKDHLAKLEKRLEPYGRVSLTLINRDGVQHRITREFDEAGGNPYINNIRPADDFRCQFLSQGEIVRLAESEDEQIRFIDSFFDFRAYQLDLDGLRTCLAELDGEVVARIKSHKKKAELDNKIKGLDEQIKEKDNALKSPVFGEYRAAQTQDHLLKRGLETLEALAGDLATARRAIEAGPEGLGIDPLLEEESPAIKRMSGLVGKARNAALKSISVAIDEAGAVTGRARAEYAKWELTAKEVTERYRCEIQKRGGDAKGLDQARQALVSARVLLVEQRAEEERRVRELWPIWNKRTTLLERYHRRLGEYTEERQQRCEWFGEKSGGQIQASVEASANREEFRGRLLALKRGFLSHGRGCGRHRTECGAGRVRSERSAVLVEPRSGRTHRHQ